MFYCNFRHQQDLTATNIIGAILKQVVVKDQVLEHVQAAFQEAKQKSAVKVHDFRIWWRC